LTLCVEQQAPQDTGTQKAQEITVLEQGQPILRELTAGENHVYQITLAEGDFLSVAVEQHGIDVAVKMLGPDGKQISEIDSEIRREGEETVSQVVEVAGSYRLIIQSVQRVTPAGRYEIRVAELRAATERDRQLQEARKMGAESLRLFRGGKYEEARPLAERALEIRMKELGPDHLDVSQSLHLLANNFYGRGDYAKAEPLYQGALAIRMNRLGSEHPDVAMSLNNLAGLYSDKGDYVKAEPLCQRALAILEKTLGLEHPNVALALNNLALIYYEKGDYARAEQFHQRALSTWEKTLGLEHPNVAASLNNLAVTYRVKGDYAKAGQFYQRALSILEKTLGAEHPHVATSLNNLALIYYVKGDVAKSEQSHQRALSIREKTLGAEHPEVAQSLNNLAGIYRIKRDFAKAEPLNQRALEIWEKKLGLEHPDVATSLNDLANLYHDKGDYARAEPLYQRALAIREKVFGSEHSLVARTLNDLSALNAAKGDIAQSLDFQSRFTGISEQNIIFNLRTGSERQKLAYLTSLPAGTSRTISLHVRYAPDNQSAASLAATTILQRKGRILDAMSDSFAALRQRFNPEDQVLLDRLNEITAQLARLVLGRPKRTAPAEHQKQIRELEEEKEELEAEISLHSAEFRAQSQPITLAAVQAAIPPNAVLLEFASYRPYNAKAAGGDKEYGNPCYAAYLLRREGEIQWKELGEAKTIDEAVDAFRRALSDPKRRDIQTLARVVDERVLQPLRALIGGATQVLVSPDGVLNLIPFEALVDEHGRYLIERYSFSYLSSGRDLLRLQVEQQSKSDPLVLADPVFGELSEPAKANVSKRKASARLTLRQSVTTGSDLSSVYFAPLMGTALEAREIKSLFPEARIRLGNRATEASLKQAVAPQILHIATHGFFLHDQPVMIEGTRGPSFLRNEGDPGGLNVDVKIENPLLRSGLALAGANLRMGPDDGILTALEASGLNLWGTKLVVLSACDTGVGVVRTGEGVYGLRRALVLAGSEAQVMSLWQVSDYVTRRLMQAYYAGLKRGQGRGEALRRVKLEIMRQKGIEHPFYWAGFIQSGKWTELSNKR
jgi:CHAT domain-containing protein/tetratricopeptide (TPR) repeat protein